MSYEEAAVSAPNFQRRPSKFTPERIQQIRDLIARGRPARILLRALESQWAA
jgi:hypothetical protein